MIVGFTLATAILVVGQNQGNPGSPKSGRADKGRVNQGAGKQAPPNQGQGDPKQGKQGQGNPGAGIPGGQPPPGVAAPAAPLLPQDVVERVRLAAMDIQRGRTVEAHKVLQPMVEQANPAELKALDGLLRELKINLGFVAVVVECRVRAANAGRNKELRPPGPVEAPAAVSALSAVASALVAPIDRELQQPMRPNLAPASLDQRLYQLLDFQDQLDVARNAQLAVIEIARSARPEVRKRLPVTATKKAAKNLEDQCQERTGRIVERVAEACLVRLPSSVDALGNDRASFADRLKAATRVEETLAILDRYWAKYRARKPEDAKKAEADWKRLAEAFPAKAGDVRVKAHLLEQGKEWWLRARYGQGALQAGLVKASAPGPRQYEQMLFAPLRMPDPIGRPDNPLERPRAMPIPRRHSEIWKAVRPLARAESDAGVQGVLARRKWKLEIAGPENLDVKRLAARLDDSEPSVQLVGFLEYQMALVYFQRVFDICTPEERKGLEESIASDDRMIVHSYLSRKFDLTDPASPLRMNPEKTADPRAKDVYERRGLSWVVALAKVELGAMQAIRRVNEWRMQMNGSGNEVSAQTGQPGNVTWEQVPQPGRSPVYELAPPVPFDSAAFAEIMLDGIRSEFSSLRGAIRVLGPLPALEAKGVQTVIVGSPDERIARCSVLQEMIAAYSRLYASSLAFAQQQELRAWHR
ncbi:MAG TPA: hypothetical protein VNC50_13955, partial [Planctomycetia bacterium]|nr:hypothetical protein [Planctomycetia bacterium]